MPVESDKLNIWKLTQLRELSGEEAGIAPGPEPERVFQSLTNELEVMGNPNRVAYGGCASALALAAAFASLDGRDMAPYSTVVHFLGGSDAAKPLRMRVRSLRETRTFATRFVLVTQQQRDGAWRGTLSATVDFILPTPRKSDLTLLEYSIAPEHVTVRPDELPDRKTWLETARREKRFDEQQLAAFDATFSTAPRYSETRIPPDSMLGQKLWGIHYRALTTQDDLSITARYSMEFFRSTEDLSALSKQASPAIKLSLRALTACWAVFYLDGALAFLPLVHTGGKTSKPLFFPHTSACSTLEAAIRWHTEDMDSSQWHHREFKTLVGGHERTYTETRIFDQNDRLAMTASQQSVLRAARPTSSNERQKL